MSASHRLWTERLSTLPAIATVAAGVLVSAGYPAAAPEPGSQMAATEPLPPLPPIAEPVEDARVLHEIYAFAATNRETLRYVPCFCKCGLKRGHRSAEDCFLLRNEDGSNRIAWNDHGAQCHICIAVARDVKRLLEQGLGTAEIRRAIDADFGPKFPHRTNTPLPPPGHGARSRHSGR